MNVKYAIKSLLINSNISIEAVDHLFAINVIEKRRFSRGYLDSCKEEKMIASPFNRAYLNNF